MHRSKLSLTILVLVLAALLFACGGGPPTITDVVTAKSLDDSSRPVDPTSTYQPEDKFLISVGVENLVVGSQVTVKYKLDGELYEETTLTADKAGSGYYGFSLMAGEYGHVPGNYTAETYLDNVLVKTITFTVEGSSEGEILNVVMTREFGEGQAPTDPTDTFGPKDEIGTAVETRYIRTGSEIKLVYTYEDGQSMENVQVATETGSGYFGFTVSPSDDGHPLGNYTVQAFLDGTPFGDPVSYTVTE